MNVHMAVSPRTKFYKTGFLKEILYTRRDVHRYNYRVLDFLTSMSPPVYYLLNPKGEESLRERGSVWLVPATRGWWKVRAAGAACLPASLPLSYER